MPHHYRWTSDRLWRPRRRCVHVAPNTSCIKIDAGARTWLLPVQLGPSAAFALPFSLFRGHGHENKDPLPGVRGQQPARTQIEKHHHSRDRLCDFSVSSCRPSIQAYVIDLRNFFGPQIQSRMSGARHTSWFLHRSKRPHAAKRYYFAATHAAACASTAATPTLGPTCC